MNKEEFIEKTLQSASHFKHAVPKTTFEAVWQKAQQQPMLVAIISYPKVMAVAAAFSGLLLLNIWLIKSGNVKENNKMQQLIDYYNLVQDDFIPLSQ